MKSISESRGRNRAARLIGILLLLAISGCQFMPQSASEDADKTAATAADAELAVARSLNPYLLERPTVPSAARKRFASAQQAMQEQQWAQAESDLLWLNENYPELSGPYLSLALVYRQTGDVEKAEAAFRAALTANANNIDAYNQFGIFLRSEGRFSEAEEVYQQALVHWPDSPDTHLNLGILYDLYMGRLQDALIHYRTYQDLQETPDRRVQGWIVDTERRLKAGGGKS